MPEALHCMQHFFHSPTPISCLLTRSLSAHTTICVHPCLAMRRGVCSRNVLLFGPRLYKFPFIVRACVRVCLCVCGWKRGRRGVCAPRKNLECCKYVNRWGRNCIEVHTHTHAHTSFFDTECASTCVACAYGLSISVHAGANVFCGEF